MKRLLGVLLVLSLAVPLAASGNPPTQDKVDGTVEDIFPSTLHVAAISDANGSNARGNLWYHAENPGFTINVAGEVTCLNVVGNMATIGMRIDRAKLPGLVGEGDGFLFVVNDNGEPGDMDTHLDIPQAVPPTVCPNPFLFVFPHKSGNFIVRDAP